MIEIRLVCCNWIWKIKKIIFLEIFDPTMLLRNQDFFMGGLVQRLYYYFNIGTIQFNIKIINYVSSIMMLMLNFTYSTLLEMNCINKFIYRAGSLGEGWGPYPRTTPWFRHFATMYNNNIVEVVLRPKLCSKRSERITEL